MTLYRGPTVIIVSLKYFTTTLLHLNTAYYHKLQPAHTYLHCLSPSSYIHSHIINNRAELPNSLTIRHLYTNTAYHHTCVVGGRYVGSLPQFRHLWETHDFIRLPWNWDNVRRRVLTHHSAQPGFTQSWTRTRTRVRTCLIYNSRGPHNHKHKCKFCELGRTVRSPTIPMGKRI